MYAHLYRLCGLSVLAAVASCGGGGSAPMTPAPLPLPNPVLTGRFGGVASDSTTAGVSDAWDWQLTQAGSSFTGLLTACTVSNCPTGFKYQGTISGTVSDATVSFTLSVPEGGVSASPACTMALTGTGTVTRRTGLTPSTAVEGTYSGTLSCGPPITGGTFFVTRAD